MTNISVVYATKTQHSRKIAKAIGREHGIDAKNITEHPHPEETSLPLLKRSCSLRPVCLQVIVIKVISANSL